MAKTSKSRAVIPKYMPQNQLSILGFETPFEKSLDPTNRWIRLSNLIPWDEICNIYLIQNRKSDTGRTPLSPRLVLGSIIIKHLCNLDDREVVLQISENPYLQYFLGYSNFSTTPPFDASMMVHFRQRLGADSVNKINEKIVELKTRMEALPLTPQVGNELDDESNNKPNEPEHFNKGRLICDATACPQDIAFPTDLNLLSDARVKTEELIDILYNSLLHTEKPRTYRNIARKRYLNTAQKKNKHQKVIRKAVRTQLSYVNRNLKSIDLLLDGYKEFTLNHQQQRYLWIISTLFEQQKRMWDTRTHTVEHRIVSIHQPHVRPIVRGKTQAKVEFGAKIHVSLVDGISFLDELSWDAYNEGGHLMKYIEMYNTRFGFYPSQVLVDQVYCTRSNRAALKEKNIKLLGKPLGRPSAVKHHVSPGERNPIEGKFGQAKTGYGLNRIKARLKGTSEVWIACIILVLNLVKLAGVALHNLLLKMIFCFSATINAALIAQLYDNFVNRINEKMCLEYHTVKR
jgi:hypothetical protein